MSRQDALLRSLERYYSDIDCRRQLAAVVGRKSDVSLRIIDWLTTNYAKKHNVVYHVAGEDKRSFNVFLEYKACLRSFSKKYFDPFARNDRVEFDDGDGKIIKTTVAQQNFFRWAIKNGVVEYAKQHVAEIEADMIAAIQHRYAQQRSLKRKELSKAAVRSCTKTNISVTVKFT